MLVVQQETSYAQVPPLEVWHGPLPARVETVYDWSMAENVTQYVLCVPDVELRMRDPFIVAELAGRLLDMLAGTANEPIARDMLNRRGYRHDSQDPF